ncbi:GH92 family glycosyl hydrolase [Phyllobacterium sp. SB3]|uniref:GH92 family glycosyl hydrolase n=1 Tax=Phyllobacterium sp. SB3 TaxID=3156073 RepID=UPI0032AF6F85
MFFKRTFVVMLLGTTMLAGCKGDSDSKVDTNTVADVSQGTFDTQTTRVGDSQKTDEELLGLIAGLKSGTDADTAETRALIADLEKRLAQKDATAGWQEVVAKLEARISAAETDLKGFKDLNLEILGSDVADLKSKMQIVQNDITTLQELQDRLTALGTRIDALKETTLSKEDLARVQGLDVRLQSLSEDFAKELASKVELTSFDKLDADVKRLDASATASKSEFEAAHKSVDAKLALLETSAKGGELSTKALGDRLAKLEADLKPLEPEVREDIAGLTGYVNPLIGSGQVPKSDVPGSTEDLLGGFVNPGAKVPFGMVSWGPETDAISGTWSPRGYHYETDVIHGFPMINLNGVGCGTQAPFMVQPVAKATDQNAKFSHANETAKPGYYRVQFDNNIETELTATTRTGAGRFTFPDGSNAILKFNFSNAKIDTASRTISASTRGGGFCGGPFYNIYFHAEFDQPFTSNSSGTVLTFVPTVGSKTTIGMKAGISYVSTANAKENLLAENASLSFDEVRKNADDAWNKRLNGIQITGGSSDDRTKFYTALYHTFFAPSVFNDVNGQYVSFDGKGTVEKVEQGRTHYTTFSSWDSYRSLTPLQALLAPKEASDMAQSLVNDAKQCGGVFPMWVDATSNSNVMPGDGASIIVAQNYAFGADNFDTTAARQIMLDMALNKKTSCKGVTPLPFLQNYIDRGYLAIGEGPMAYGENTPASNTLEYASTDFAISRFLTALDSEASQLVINAGTSDAADLLKRSGNWSNHFNPEWEKVAGQPYPQLQPRNADGTWPVYTPALYPNGAKAYREGNAEQYTYMVPHDIRGLFRVLVKDKTNAPNSEVDALARLDTFTTHLAGGEQKPYLWVGNEPSFATPFMYNWTSQPYKTQALVRRVLNELFGITAQGLPGNEDEGALSGRSVVAAFCDGTWRKPVYFYATFDKPLKTASSKIVGGFAQLHFDVTDTDKSVSVKIGISSVSVENAKLNLETENKDLSFDALKAQASAEWNRRLNTIQLDLAKPEELAKVPAAQLPVAKTNLTKFYTALYRVYSGPTVYSDVNGEYRSMKQTTPFPAANTVPVRATENVSNYKFKLNGQDAGYNTHYSGFSMWDTYRSQAQLIALVAPNEASEMMQSLVADAKQCGAIPHWVDGSDDTIPMQGDHGTNVVAGSYVFGARKFDVDSMRTFMKQSAFKDDSACNDKLSVGRNGDQPVLPTYKRLGYVPTAFPSNPWKAGSATVEMVTSDRSIGAFLKALPTATADKAEIDELLVGAADKGARASNWTNIFHDTQKKLIGKDVNSNWSNASDIFHESTEENYIWAFAHDWSALIEKLGGKSAALDRLNKLFVFSNFTGIEPTGRQLNSGESGATLYIGNEPAFQTPWAYNWAGSPKHAQYVIPIIMNKTFTTNPGGLPGNDDMGATSTWYVLAALGLYPVIPSEAGFAVSTPQFSGINLWLGNGRKLRIETDKQAMLDDTRYISEMKLGDAAYKGTWLPLDKIANGGKLSFTLSKLTTEWGAAPELTPPSGPNADYSKATAKPLPGPQLIQ